MKRFRGRRPRPRGKRRFRKRRFPKRRSVVSRAIRAIGRPELKYDDTVFTLLVPVVSTTLTVNNKAFLVHNVTQGTGGSSTAARIGNSTLLRGFASKMTVTINPTVNSVATTYRCILLVDRQPNGVQFTSGELFESNASTSAMAVSPYLRTYNRRFKILYDKTFSVDCDVKGATAEQQTRRHRIFKKLYLTCRYADTNVGSIADINSNALWFLFIPYNYDPAGPPLTHDNLIVNLWFRCWFTDV